MYVFLRFYRTYNQCLLPESVLYLININIIIIIIIIIILL